MGIGVGSAGECPVAMPKVLDSAGEEAAVVLLGMQL